MIVALHIVYTFIIKIVDVFRLCFLYLYRYSSLSAYGQPKLANVLHANELARRLKVSVILMNLNEINDLVMVEEMMNGIFFLT